MEEIAKDIWVESSFRGANASAVITSEGAILIDTPMVPEQAQAWERMVRSKLNGLPILYVINTDHHRGHCLGNQWFDAPVIAHEAAWKEMKSYGDNFRQRVIDSFKKEPVIAVQFTELKVRIPEVTFADRLTLVRGGRTLRMIHVGGHTPATSVVYMPDERIIFTGDCVMTDQHPFMAQSRSKDWLDALTFIRKLGDDVKVVPGHGPVSDRTATEKLSEYIRHLRQVVRQAWRSGKTKQEAANMLVGELLNWYPIPAGRKDKIEQQIKQGINKVYEEIKVTSPEAMAA